MAAAPTKFRIDVGIQNLLQNSNGRKPIPVVSKALSLPKPVFPQYPDKLNDPGPEKPPDGNRKWGFHPIYRAMRGWLYPYIRSRVLAGDFHPITSYLFLEYKCNLDCWYCWSFAGWRLSPTSLCGRRLSTMKSEPEWCSISRRRLRMWSRS